MTPVSTVAKLLAHSFSQRLLLCPPLASATSPTDDSAFACCRPKIFLSAREPVRYWRRETDHSEAAVSFAKLSKQDEPAIPASLGAALADGSKRPRRWQIVPLIGPWLLTHATDGLPVGHLSHREEPRRI